jgi:Zn-dependent M28 family amino/carboxypeptidase
MTLRHESLLRPVTLLLFSMLSANIFHAATADPAAPTPPRSAVEAITAADLLKHIKILASDAFEGRAPGSRGEELSVAYITAQFKALGLQPGNPDGTYIQEVPLAGITSTPTATFTIGGKTTALHFPDDFVAGSERLVPEIKAENSGVVFVGYGVVAPEYGWDDYKDVDVRGKTLLMLINDPAIPDPHDPAKLDARMFKGKEMTYYGRWTYKYEIAAKKGAAAAVIIHETGPAGYQYSVVRLSWGKENFTLDAPDGNIGAVPVRAWITEDVAKKLCADSGHDLQQLKRAALSRDFRPIEMGITANFDIKQAVRPFKSHNVVATLPGANPALADQWVLYTGHWDHLGKHPDLHGHQIFNGAVDNASGVAAVLNIAQAFTAARPGPERSILFMATTAEEAGLLGARYYAEHPLYPLTRTLADINIDGVGVNGKTADIEDMSNDNSTLDDLLGQLAARQGRTLKPNSRLENGGFYRADHFEFAKVGVPALYTKHGIDLIGKPAGLGDELETEYIVKRYHKPADQVSPDWDLSGAAQDMQLLFEVGWAVANGDGFPQWKPGSEFKARRDEMMAHR